MSLLRHSRHAFSAFRPDSIAQRLLLYIILCSSGATLLATSLQLYLDYRRDIDVIDTRLNEIESSYLASIGASLWNLDIKQLELQMDGIMRLPDMQLVEVIELGEPMLAPLHLTRGTPLQQRVLMRDYPIIHQLPDSERQIGSLRVQVSLTAVYQRLWDKAIVIFLSQGVKTFLVSLFILYIVYFLVTRHLSQISQFLQRWDMRNPDERLHLDRGRHERNDELHHVVSAFNNMADKLVQTYAQLRTTNEQLQEDIAARIAAETEVVRLNMHLEQRVHQRTAELEAANKELGTFCYSVSHDLRAPLRRIEGFRRLLKENYLAHIDETGQHYLNRIEAGTREMADMIDSFLRLSRATQGEMDVQRQDLSQLGREIAARLRERDPDRSLDILIQPNMEDDIDRRFFEVLLNNLLENAWKYSRNSPHAKITFGRVLKAGEWVYHVTDNGVGFDMAYANRLFSPFNRLHRAEEFEGMGIGLATVQRIVARHGGRIWAESVPGEGACFYFTLWSRNNVNGDGNHSPG